MVRTRIVSCNSCNDDGLLWYRVHEEVVRYRVEYVARCGSCNAWKKFGNISHWPTRTRWELDRDGLDVYPYTAKRRKDLGHD